jgi:hypothetical protein
VKDTKLGSYKLKKKEQKMQWQQQNEKNKQYSTKHCSEDLEIDQHEPYKRPW